MENRQITTAVIAVAGWGTRWLPLTKAVEKCMLPVGNRPVIDWIVADCAAANITRIIFVIGEAHAQIQQYFSHHAALNDYLTAQDRGGMLDMVDQPQYEAIHFEFVVQPNDGRYGTAYPVALAVSKLGANEPILFLNGDDFIYRTDGGSETHDFIAAWQHSDAPHALMVSEVTREEASKYGVIRLNDEGHCTGIAEKPTPEQLDSFDRTYINLGKYIFSSSMLQEVQNYMDEGAQEKEFFLTTPINRAADAGDSFMVHTIAGQHLDTGNPTSWLRTNWIVMNR